MNEKTHINCVAENTALFVGLDWVGWLEFVEMGKEIAVGLDWIVWVAGLFK